MIDAFFQASRRVDFSANPLADLSFDFYDSALLDEVGFCFCFLYFFNVPPCLIIYLFC